MRSALSASDRADRGRPRLRGGVVVSVIGGAPLCVVWDFFHRAPHREVGLPGKGSLAQFSDVLTCAIFSSLVAPHGSTSHSTRRNEHERLQESSDRNRRRRHARRNPGLRSRILRLWLWIWWVWLGYGYGGYGYSSYGYTTYYSYDA